HAAIIGRHGRAVPTRKSSAGTAARAPHALPRSADAPLRPAARPAAGKAARARAAHNVSLTPPPPQRHDRAAPACDNPPQCVERPARHSANPTEQDMTLSIRDVQLHDLDSVLAINNAAGSAILPLDSAGLRTLYDQA